MKLRLIPLVAAVSMSLTGLAHAEGPINGKVYGKINLSLQSEYQEGTGSKLNVQDNASRLGFKGKSAIEGQQDLSAIYQIELGLHPDQAGTSPKLRNSFVGLAGGFGTVLAGNHDTPLKMSQGKVDQFNDTYGDLAKVFQTSDKHTKSEIRASKIVMFRSINMSGLSADLAMIASDKKTSTRKNGISTAVKFKQDGLYAALAYDKDVAADGTKTLRLVGQYTMGDIQLGAIFQNTKYIVTSSTTEDKLKSALVSAAYSLGKTKLKAQYATTKGDMSSDKRNQLTLGADYKLAKLSKVFGFVSMYDQKNVTNGKAHAIGLGFEQKF
jgi:hypothetical protein